MGLELVVPGAENSQVGPVRRTSLVPGNGMVDLASMCWALTTREAAGLVAFGQEGAKWLADPVGGAATVDQPPGEGLGDQASQCRGAPLGEEGPNLPGVDQRRGTRAVTADGGGNVGQANERRQIDGDGDLRHHLNAGTGVRGESHGGGARLW